MKVKRNTLLLIACLVWTLAGGNILRVGLMAYRTHVTAGNILLSVLVFAVFRGFIFRRLVARHTCRILGYADERQFFLKFFDRKAFVLMAGMMLGGMGLRACSAVPDVLIAVFYSGLGTSLLLAGLQFGLHYWKAMQANA